MERKWRELFRAYAGTPEHQARVREARNLIAAAFRRHRPGHCYVAFSGGKDSTALLHLVLSQPGGAEVLVWHWDYGPYYMPRWVEREVRDNLHHIAHLAGVQEPRVRYDSSSRYWKAKRNPVPVFYVSFFGRVEPELHQAGYRCVFVGLRGQEAVHRRLKVKRGQGSSRLMQEVFPVGNWTWKDVWAYIVHHGLPYPRVYDRYARVLGWDKVRFSTFFDPEMDKFGSGNLDSVLMWRFRNADIPR